jgi:hopanoid biosynthesis associated RND transporter like protein HpnN
MTLANLLARLVDWSRRHAAPVFCAGLILAGLGSLYSVGHLGIITDTDQMFPSSLPWRQQQMALDHAFPQFSNLLVVVLDSPIPEASDATAAALVQALRSDPAHFLSARNPQALPFYGQEGLLFLSEPDLRSLLERLITAQPLLGQLVADPSGRGLFSALSLMALGLVHGGVDLSPYAAAFAAIHHTIAGTLAGHPQPLSWLNLLSGPAASEGGTSRIVLVQPRLDYGSLQPGGAATVELRKILGGLPYVQQGLVHVGITGQIALSDEQFASVLKGAVSGTIATILLVTLWLFLAAKSWRIVVPIALTLMLGLLLTTTFAAIAIGTLNLISMAFAILFVGIAVDFSIQFSVRFREMRFLTGQTPAALTATAAGAGSQILVAALGAAAGFLAFVPTQFRGVAELGLIAGTGMLIAFICTMTFLPASLTLFRPRGERAEIGFQLLAPLERGLARRAQILLGIFAALAILGATVLPRVSFDGDPLDTRSPHSEAVMVLRRLLQNPVTNPYSAQILAPSVAAAGRLASALRAQPAVGTVLSIQTFVPDNQNQKLALIADTEDILGPTLSVDTPTTAVTPAELRLAIRTALSSFAQALPKLPHDSPLVALDQDLKALETAPDSVLMATSHALTAFLPDQINRLRTALSAEPVTLANVPPALKRDWVLPDGRALVEALAKPGEQSSQGLGRFVAAVRSLAPDAGGPAVNIVGSADIIVGAFRSAAISALIAIAIILGVILRRPRDVALVMAPLLLSGLLTAILIVRLPLPINFANIIALPLLLGVGVSFNVYFVMNWRTGGRQFLTSATARAILFSALTTGTAFGSLALSADRGTASLGTLLLLSLGATLLSTLIFVPALLNAITPGPEETSPRA